MVDIATITQVAEKVSTPTKGASSPVGGHSAFEQLMQKTVESSSNNIANHPVVKNVLADLGLQPQTQQVTAISGEGLEIATTQVNAAQEIRSQDKVMNFVTDVNRGALQLENMVSLISSTPTLDTRTLLSIQAGMYNMAQQVELFGKVVEVGNSSFKQTYNLQI